MVTRLLGYGPIKKITILVEKSEANFSCKIKDSRIWTPKKYV
ncbi:protein of unknown function [Candidatus Nitrosocosmicus franklandus]|uniref:Uncharacterized protein n=1 Tax=Candidatus Nitrosocosmicus franklandianus TaxID=1798806 RepID=A0A484IBV8_9ARCH|nr:protein of unknown function [Candidatus Nitrosocosmicus franklandus]